jgi:hypothetical protein
MAKEIKYLEFPTYRAQNGQIWMYKPNLYTAHVDGTNRVMMQMPNKSD